METKKNATILENIPELNCHPPAKFGVVWDHGDLEYCVTLGPYACQAMQRKHGVKNPCS